MQNRYTGDAGDFGKFGLMRVLAAADSAMRLGLVWYLFPDEDHTGDGKHIRYLVPTPRNDRLFRACDPELYDSLRKIVESGRRHVDQVRAAGLLPASTVYFEELLDFKVPPRQRETCRRAWLDRALATTAACDIVLLDPDNGLECSVGKQAAKAGKYVYFDEIKPMFARGQTVIIYQHVDRTGPAVTQISRRAHLLQQHLRLPQLPSAIRHRRGTSRVYYFCTQPRHADAVARTLASLTSGPWTRQFELAELFAVAPPG